MKKAQGGTGANQYKEQSGQNVQSAATSESIAAQHKVSERTVRRAGDFAAAVEKIQKVQPELRQQEVCYPACLIGITLARPSIHPDSQPTAASSCGAQQGVTSDYRPGQAGQEQRVQAGPQ